MVKKSKDRQGGTSLGQDIINDSTKLYTEVDITDKFDPFLQNPEHDLIDLETFINLLNPPPSQALFEDSPQDNFPFSLAESKPVEKASPSPHSPEITLPSHPPENIFIPYNDHHPEEESSDDLSSMSSIASLASRESLTEISEESLAGNGNKAINPTSAATIREKIRPFLFQFKYTKEIRRRQSLTPEQRNILIQYQSTHAKKPTTKEREALATKVELTSRQVQVWFQNHKKK